MEVALAASGSPAVATATVASSAVDERGIADRRLDPDVEAAQLPVLQIEVKSGAFRSIETTLF